MKIRSIFFFFFFCIYVHVQIMQWMRTEFWSGYIYGMSVSSDGLGYIYFVGSDNSGGFLSKYDDQGNKLWSDTSVHALFNDATTDSAGNTYTAGSIVCKF